ncbi:CHAT domain-containing protein [Kribbella sp. NPDC051718]|uniref:CHAT domain-containing protein n=1 Tax=Kribbella sp. NPDC051718 TaxID=3155168 RepID=UPI00341ADF8D
MSWGRGPKAKRDRALRFIRGVTSRYERSQDPTELLSGKSAGRVRDAMVDVLRSDFALPVWTSEVDVELAKAIAKYYWCRYEAGADEIDRSMALEYDGLADRGELTWEAFDPMLNREPPPETYAEDVGASEAPDDGVARDDGWAVDVTAAELVEEFLPYAAEHGPDAAAANLMPRLYLHRSLDEADDLAGTVAALFMHEPRARRLGLDVAEALFSEIAAISPDPAARSQMAANIGVVLRTRFERFGVPADIDGAIEAGRTAQVLAGVHPELDAEASYVLGRALLVRGVQQSSAEDLAESVTAFFQATQRAAPNNPRRWMYLEGRAVALRDLALATGDLPRLDEAIEFAQIAIRFAPPDQQPGPRVNLSAALISRLDRTGRLADLDDAYDAAEQAVRAGESPSRMQQLARVLLRRYEWRNGAEDLDSAIRLYSGALDLLYVDSARHREGARDLGLAHQRRFARYGERSDLYNAIYYGAMAAEPNTDSGRDRLERLANYGLELGQSLKQADDQQLAAEAIAVARRGLDAVDTGHPDRVVYLHNYVTAYLRAQPDGRTGGAELDRVISAAEESVGALSQDHSSRPRSLNLLATSLVARYDVSLDPADLADAELACRESLDTASDDDPQLHLYVIGLANVRVREFRAHGDHEVARTVIGLARDVVADSAVPTSLRAQISKLWGEVAAELGDWSTALEGFSLAVGLLPELVWRGLEHRERRRLLAELAGLPSQAAATALTQGRPELAIELLETGRGVLLMSPGAEADPELAELHEQLNGLTDRREYWAGSRRRELARRWDELTARLRATGGSQYKELRDAAVGGPVVVVNVSRYRCDALIVTGAGLTVVPLPAIDLPDVVRHAEEFDRAVSEPGRLRSRVVVRQTCDWLWETIASPVLSVLEPTSATRVWWCSTGPMMALPLHAAGEVPDRVISSYTPTLTALIAARGRADQEWRSALIVAMPETPGLSALPHAKRESEVAASRLPVPQVLSGPDATWQDVVAAMSQADVVHFACHGRQDADVPSDGRLILADDPLTVVELIRIGVVPKFAFLSACETARGDVGVPDESLHLAGALFLAGCPQVIGTVWPVSDARSVDLVAEVYDALPADGAASALHAAVATVRRRFPDDPMRWASHVHFGP